VNLDGSCNEIKIDDNTWEGDHRYNISAMCETIEQMRPRIIELETKIEDVVKKLKDSGTQ
jgi:hypothetical protein